MSSAAAAAPFHVLLLAGGNRQPPKKEGEPAPAEVDDYLSRRDAFRTKQALHIGARKAGEDPSSNNEGGEGVAGEIAKLQGLASRLEIAIAACCERAAPEGEARDGNGGGPSSPTSAAQHHSRSRLHRPLFPSNYVAPDPSAVPEASASSSGPIKMEEAEKPKGPTRAGILRSGKEGHFAKLLFMYFPKQSVGHRALAVAILQRTVDWERSDKNNVSAGEDKYRRTKSFLAAGGMKLLSRWLVDAYTMVPAAQSSSEKKGHGKPGQNQPAPLVASPTACLLLPILKLLKTFPFDKDIVVDSGIHKSIKRLNKGLGKLVEQGTATHAITGGISVKKVFVATESVKTLWNEAAKVKASGEDIRLAFDPLRQMREKVLSRFGELTRYQIEGGEPPEWMPQSIVGMRVLHAGQMQQSPSPPKGGKGGEEKEDHLPDIQARPGQNKRTMDGMFQPRKRKNPDLLAAMLEPIKKSSKKVSWTDRPLGSNAIPRPLREERIFVKEAEEAEVPPVAAMEVEVDVGQGKMSAEEIGNIAAQLLANSGAAQEVEIPDELLADSGTAAEVGIPDELLADTETSEDVAIPDELLADAGEDKNQEEDDSDDDIMEDLF